MPLRYSSQGTLGLLSKIAQILQKVTSCSTRVISGFTERCNQLHSNSNLLYSVTAGPGTPQAYIMLFLVMTSYLHAQIQKQSNQQKLLIWCWNRLQHTEHECQLDKERFVLWSVVSLESEPVAHSKDGDKLMTHHATSSHFKRICLMQKCLISRRGTNLFDELHQSYESQSRQALVKGRDLHCSRRLQKRVAAFHFCTILLQSSAVPMSVMQNRHAALMCCSMERQLPTCFLHQWCSSLEAQDHGAPLEMLLCKLQYGLPLHRRE